MLPPVKRYAGDRFVGPTGDPAGFPLDVADGAVLYTSGDLVNDQASYIKVSGAWQQVIQTGVVLETMTGDLLDKYSDQDVYGIKTFHNDVFIRDLTVTGTQTALNTVDSTIKDNIIIINSGESGVGITFGSGGFVIDRGSEEDAFFLFDETLSGDIGYTGGFNFNFNAHVTGDRLVRASETGVFQTQINVVHETGFTVTTGVSALELTGVTSIYDIDGVNSGEADILHKQQIQCYVGGVIQSPERYSMLDISNTPTITFVENLFSGIRTNFVYSSTDRVL
jgi:hypothetical protein